MTFLMARRSILGLTILAAGFFGACDKGGVYPLGVSKDVIVQCDVQSTWMRSIEGATEVFVVGTRDFATLDAQLEDGVAVCFNFATVEYNTTTRLFSGILRTRSAGYVVELPAEYNYKHEPEKNIVLRSGARRTDHDPPLRITDVDFTMDAERLVLDYDGSSRRLTQIGDVVARLDPAELDQDAPGGAKDAFRLYNLALFVGQPRIPGFGGTGMTQYTTKTTFNALIDGYFTVKVDSIATPHVLLEYFATEELDGIVIDGPLLTKVTLSGDGPMEGDLAIDMQVDPDDEDAPHVRLTVTYDDLDIENGVAAAGFYTLVFENGNEHVLDHTMAADEDLRGVLPVAEGVP
jgi:hypothetical protein